MSLGVFIASAAGWDDRRREPLKRLQAQLPGAITVVSETKEHSSVWSKRLYARALASGHDHCLFLNDDVIPFSHLESEVRAMIEAVPDQVLSLHTGLPEAATFKGPWLRSYLVNGPAYVYPRAELQGLVAFYEVLPKLMRDKMNEDEVAAHYQWSVQRPAWHSIPALVKHDTSVPSTLGYDHHAARGSTAPYDQMRMPADWHVESEPPLCPHPWLPENRMMRVKRAIAAAGDDTICSYCAAEYGMFPSDITGARICNLCVLQINTNVFGNLRVG